MQRNLRIGYNRPAGIIEDMEKAGLVTPMQSDGNRKIISPDLTDSYETYIDIVGIDEYSDAEKRAQDAYQKLINPPPESSEQPTLFDNSKKKYSGKVKILFKDFFEI